jgi:hypothetical protein
VVYYGILRFVLSTTAHPVLRLYNIGALPFYLRGWTEENNENLAIVVSAKYIYFFQFPNTAEDSP